MKNFQIYSVYILCAAVGVNVLANMIESFKTIYYYIRLRKNLRTGKVENITTGAYDRALTKY